MQRVSFFRRHLTFGIALLFLWQAPAISEAQQISTQAVDHVAGREVGARRLLIKLRASATAGDVADIETQSDADVDTPVGDGSLRLVHSRSKSVAELIATLAQHARVEYVEPDYILHALDTPDDPGFVSQWALSNTGQTVDGAAGAPGADVHATGAWDIARGSANTVIGIVDGGFDYTHVDLADNVWSAPRAFTVVVGGMSLTCPAGTHGVLAWTNLSCDPLYPGAAPHATHVAGIAGAAGNNGSGIVGASWHASMMSLNFMPDGSTGYESDAINAIEFAIQVKTAFAGSPAGNVRILNNSWAGASNSQALQDEIDRAGANDILFVDAAGNSSANIDSTPDYPASFNRPTQLTVASSTSSDTLSSFSNFSENSVHLAAPGSNIFSTVPGGYGYMSGTSMASPLVAGAAALVLSRCSMNTADLKTLLMNTVDPLASFAQTTVSGGRLNIEAALKACAVDAPDSPPSVSLVAPLDGTAYSQSATVNLLATAADTDGSIARVDFYAGTTLIGTTTVAPYSFSWSAVAAGTYAVTALATDNEGAQTRSDAVTVMVGAQSGPGALPSPWQQQDVGQVGVAGSASYSNGTFTVQGAGAGISGLADAFHYVYQPMTAAGQIVARVTGVQYSGSTAQAGIAMRNDTSAGAFSVVLDLRADGTVEFLEREFNGQGISTVMTASASAPVWLKLAQIDSTLSVNGYFSTDGTNWTALGTAFPDNPPSDVGLAVSSRDTSQVNASTFDNVTVVGGAAASTEGGGSSSDIVIDANGVPSSALHGGWAAVSDTTAADGVKLATPDNGVAVTDAPLASPSEYVDVTFAASAGVPYTFWLRMQALGDSKYNDSVWVQFSDALAGQSPVYPLNSTQGLLVNLATDSSGSSLKGWGWQNGAYWLSQATTVSFATSGTHTVRIQVREDGAAWDQLVLSPATYLSASPGVVTDDHTIVGEPTTGGGGTTPPAHLPSPWVSSDVGATGQPGSATFSGGVFSVSGAGSDIWGASDSFQYVNQPVTGDVTVVARITSQQDTSSFAKAGVMLRESLAADAAHVLLDIRPTGDVEFMTRASDGANETFIAGAHLALPAWVRLVRSGTTVTASVSTDGSTWTTTGTASLAASAALAGIIVCSHTTAAAGTATFDNVSIVAGASTSLPSPWASSDVGTTGQAGSATFSGGVFSVTGAGSDIWGESDSFQYVHQSVSGDATVVARVTSQQDTSSFAKAGIMLRESLAADAAHVLLDIRPTGDIEFMARSADGADETFIAGAHLALPAWVRLVRSGTTVTASVSADGSTWTPVGTTSFGSSSALAGLIVCSHDADEAGAATFDTVSVDAGTP